MAVEGGFQRDRHGRLWEGHRWSVRLGWCRLRHRVRLAVGIGHFGLDQLLYTSGNSRAQPTLAEAMWRLGEVLTVAVAVDDVVGRAAVALAGDLGRPIGQ